MLILLTDEAVAKFKQPEGFSLSELKLESHYSGTLDAREVLRKTEKYQAKKAAYVIAMRFSDGGVLFASVGELCLYFIAPVDKSVAPVASVELKRSSTRVPAIPQKCTVAWHDTCMHAGADSCFLA